MGGVPRDHRSKPPYLRDLAYRGPPGRTTPGRAGAIDEYIDKYITPYGYGPTDAHTREDDQDEEDIDPSEAAAKLFDLLCQVGYLGHEPSGPGRQEQLNILEQLVEERSVEEVRDAIKGARHSWPYSEEENTPYDAEVVRAKFDIYLASYRQRPEIQQKGQKRAQEDDQDQGKAHEDQGKAHEEDYELRRQQWAEEIDQRFQQEDPEVRDRIRREAYDATPGKGRLSDHTREAILRSTVRRIYGQEIGQPPP